MNAYADWQKKYESYCDAINYLENIANALNNMGDAFHRIGNTFCSQELASYAQDIRIKLCDIEAYQKFCSDREWQTSQELSKLLVQSAISGSYLKKDHDAPRTNSLSHKT